ncbi:glycolate oxidase iron-sulfur subunit [Methylomarinovum caldicuralii]|uniref:Glycolate oxidase iron-sulfur subunit n=1 Tax=Methylomarinovum caldicuralii TaxID=438856 RepID=A0AAU9C163_9GAMM|nr:glycolate oxidase subunit GlcF [Methylomarinovum caldicuralii]BCX82435.1 glycolate oxidase iron-sulfur subunit [Methylomarinovum caldicuralii]
MQVELAPSHAQDPAARLAADIIRGCVHCGFCNATCPTYRLLGDELDGPRGRIYQIKDLLEGLPPTASLQKHLDRCLTCRACETTCPSGVAYGRLLDLGRGWVAQAVPRPWHQRLLRAALRFWLPHPQRLRPWYRLAEPLRPLLPCSLRARLGRGGRFAWPPPRHRRRMLILEGCVQSVLEPAIDAAAARVFDRLGISLIRAPEAGCCGALSYHLDAHDEGLDFARRNIDAWWPHVEAGAEAILVTASGCGVMVKDYGELLGGDPAYRDKARRIAELARDPAEILAGLDLRPLQATPGRVAFQSPCTLQHGQRLAGVVEGILQRLGFALTPVPDAQLCCGSAGAYSLLQPRLAARLRAQKIAALESGDPEVIASANIGCLLHLAPVATRPVRHWLELLDATGAPDSG